MGPGGGSIAQWLAYLLPDPAATCSNPSIPENFQRIFFLTLLRLFNSVESGQRLENVDQTHPILASNKQVPQKKWRISFVCKKASNGSKIGRMELSTVFHKNICKNVNSIKLWLIIFNQLPLVNWLYKILPSSN